MKRNFVDSQEEILASLNTEQRAAVLHDGGPAMIMAGAGSGKTRVLVSRAAYLISQGTQPSSILLVTFTNKAAGEMTDRVEKMTGLRLLYSGTFHRLCAKILREDGHFVGIPKSFVIYDDEDQLDLMKGILKFMHLSTKEYNPRMLLGMISKAKTEMINATEYKRIARGPYQQVAADCYLLYEDELKKNSAVDFDNLLNKTLELFEWYPEVLAKYQRRFDHVLVDEYQDVNRAQYMLTLMLARPENNLFCVGDFSQSIYGWRGADYRNMLALKSDFPNVKEYKLERNYRSSKTIVDAATAVISNNTSHPILELWTEKADVAKIQLFEAETEQHEAAFVIEEARRLSSLNDFSNIAILYRTNAQSRIFEESCIRAGIPYRLVGGVRFYARKEIKDVIAYLRLLINEKDTVSLKRIEKLGKKQLQSFLNWIHEGTRPATPLELLDAVLEQTKYLDRYDKHLEEDAARLENIQELRSVASSFSSLDDLLENIALVENDSLPDAKTAESNERALTLMSMHAAKGLEFETVFLVGMEEGLFPHSRSLMEKDQIEEERRLCYVGITRAKDRLYMSYTRRRLLYGNISGSIVSRFIAEVPQQYFSLVHGQSFHDDLDMNNGYGKRSGSSYFQRNANGWEKKKTETKRSGPHFVPDDSQLEAVLSGEMDIDTFLNG